MSEADEWVTIAEASRRLNLHARQVRRYAARLGTEDRTPEGQSPLKVRLSSIVSLRSEKEPEDTTEDRDRTPIGTGTAEKDSVPPVSLPSDIRLIEHLEAEVSFLRSSLEAASVERAELRRLLLVEQDANKRLGEVLQLMAGPKEAEPEPAAAVENPTQSDLETRTEAQTPTETGLQSRQDDRTEVLQPDAAHSPASPKAQEPAAVPKSWWVKFWDAVLLRD